MATILVATDGSDLATNAAGRAVEVFGADHTYLVMTVVRPGLVTPNPMASFDAPGSAELQDEADSPTDMLLANSAREESEALAELDSLTRHLRIRAGRQVEMGDPGESICRVAREHHANVIVIGSHGRGRTRHLFVGSVSQHVLQHAPCLVMVLGPQAG